MNSTLNDGSLESRKSDAYNLFFINWLLTIFPTIWILQNNGLGLNESIVCIVIYVTEHIFHEEYRVLFSSQDKDKRGLIICVLKTTAVAIGLVAIWCSGNKITFSDIIFVWSCVGILCTILLFNVKKIVYRKLSVSVYKKVIKNIWIHFLIGLVAFATLQVEKIISVQVLDVDELATMFRVSGIGAISTQLTTLAIFNTSVSRGFNLIRENKFKEYKRVVFSNIVKTVLLSLCLILCVELVRTNLVSAGITSVNIPKLHYIIFILLITGLKSCIDFTGVPIKARRKEKYLVVTFLLSLLMTIPLMTYAGTHLGIIGILSTSAFVSCICLLSVIIIDVKTT